LGSGVQTKEKLLSIGIEFWRKAKRSSKILRVRNEVIKRRHNNNILEKIKINI